MNWMTNSDTLTCSPRFQIPWTYLYSVKSLTRVSSISSWYLNRPIRQNVFYLKRSSIFSKELYVYSTQMWYVLNTSHTPFCVLKIHVESNAPSRSSQWYRQFLYTLRLNLKPEVTHAGRTQKRRNDRKNWVEKWNGKKPLQGQLTSFSYGWVNVTF